MTSALFTMQDEDISKLVDSVRKKYGFDFSEYSPASFRRRLSGILQAEKLANLDSLEKKILEDPIAFQRFVHGITVSVTSLFRDPGFHKALRDKVIPYLATYPFIRIWHAGCCTGEEVYSMAIILKECGLYERSRIYATDLDPVSIESARKGIYSLSNMKEYSSNYLASGGKLSLSNYYYANNDNAIFDSKLRQNIVFAQHNLVSDGSFNEFHLILCRNVMIYFNSNLRQKVLSLLHDSLVTFGILAIGTKESLRFSDIESCYESIAPVEKIYKKVI